MAKKKNPNFVKELFKSPTTTLLFILVVFLAGASIFLFQKVNKLEQAIGGVPSDAVEQPPRTELDIKKPDLNSEHFRGSKNARFVWVEYSDLECPFCKRIHPDLIKLTSEYPDQVVWVFRHYPLPIHPSAQKMSEAAECAAELGGNDAFWQYVDKVYESTPTDGTQFDAATLPQLATNIGLDQTQFNTCLDSGKYESKVKDQAEQGSKEGVQATPTNVIYDTKTNKTLLIEGALPYEQLKQQLDDFIKKQG